MGTGTRRADNGGHTYNMLQKNQTFCEYHPGITEFCLLVHFSFSISGFCPVLHLRFSQLYARGV